MDFRLTICDDDANKIVVAVLKELTKDLKISTKEEKKK